MLPLVHLTLYFHDSCAFARRVVLTDHRIVYIHVVPLEGRYTLFIDVIVNQKTCLHLAIPILTNRSHQ